MPFGKVMLIKKQLKLSTRNTEGLNYKTKRKIPIQFIVKDAILNPKAESSCGFNTHKTYS